MNKKWWHDKVAYQIYPKSFLDTNGDGIGDIPGIIQKLDYLADLGIDIIWLSPVYLSPMADQGYDIADYYRIDPRFGTMEDMEELIVQAKKRNIRILMDLVVNHCSDEHIWFQKAIEDPEGKYGSYFYLKEAEDDELPCNWRSYFGGPCWERLPGTKYKYLHLFHRKQPDLNWENPEVREEVYRNINWWLEKGLGGFRIDAIINIKKAPFHDYPADRPDGLASVQNMLKEASGVTDFLQEMSSRTFVPHDAFTVGEVFNEKPEELKRFIGENGCFSTMFDFSTTCFGTSSKGWYDTAPITPEDYKNCLFSSQKKAGNIGFLSNIIENHDEPRGASHYLPKDGQNDTGKKMLASITLMLRGIPFLYQGQELGMENTVFTSIDDVDDISTLDEYQTCLNAGLTEEEALQVISRFSRDNGRTPMQWSDQPSAGFTDGIPWLKVNPNYTRINAGSQIQDENSVFHFYKKLISLRKHPSYKDTIVYGELVPYMEEQKNLLAFYRRSDTQSLLILANYQSREQDVTLPCEQCQVLLNNYPDFKVSGNTAVLNGYQAVILLL